jgi:hypothetical protein
MPLASLDELSGGRLLQLLFFYSMSSSFLSVGIILVMLAQVFASCMPLEAMKGLAYNEWWARSGRWLLLVQVYSCLPRIDTKSTELLAVRAVPALAECVKVIWPCCECVERVYIDFISTGKADS